MAIDWQRISIALSSRLQFEMACGRGRLISEDISRIFLAETVQSQISGAIEPEINHPDLPGNTRLDLLVRSPSAQNIEAAIEHKWVRRTGENVGRQWMAEVLADLLRVETISSQMVQGSERILVVSGEVEEMRSKIWESQSRQGGGQPRVGVVNTLMQARPQSGEVQSESTTIQLRNIGRPFFKKLRHAAPELLGQLPARYAVQLVGYHRAYAEGVECAIWKISRPGGHRSTFDAADHWPET
ncbi:hypothetical protein [Marinobacter subterrani]|uniref:hypothetical protein n=1 Tax=Marinobacter subterrani TaxID=1658765 RepID=UPI002357894D|nr:hypothetical protein [Marinobacter subterrani]